MCVECGAEVPGLIDGACAPCFASHNALMVVPEVLEVELCNHCGAKHVGAHWHDVPQDEPELWTLEQMSHDSIAVHQAIEAPVLDISLEEKDKKTFEVTVVMEGDVHGVELTATGSGLLRRTRGVCNRCSRIYGGYYAAIIQFRATERDMTGPELDTGHQIVSTELNRQLQGGNRFAFLAKSEPMHGGFDYYIGDIDAARNVARKMKSRMHAQISESAKLVGRKEGEDVYRVTFLSRLPEFAPGDLLLKDDIPHAVMQVHPRNITTMDLEHMRRGRLATDHLKRVGGLELIEEAVVVSHGDDGVQILDPSTYKPTTILVPGDERLGETVPVVRIDERLYWFPFNPESTRNG